MTARIHAAGGEPATLSLSLEDISVDSPRDAQQLIHYFEKGFGLHVDVFDAGLDPRHR